MAHWNGSSRLDECGMEQIFVIFTTIGANHLQRNRHGAGRLPPAVKNYVLARGRRGGYVELHHDLRAIPDE